jgi:hypothetical protein
MPRIVRAGDSGVVKTAGADLGAIFTPRADAGAIDTTTRGHPMRLTKTLGLAGALIISALVGGTLIGSALATDEETGTDLDTSAGTPYCDTFRETLASELGVTADELTAAGKAAATAVVDAALAAGDIDEDRAADLKERIEAYDGDGCGWFGHGFARGFGQGFARGLGHGFMGAGVLESAADALGIDVAELRDLLDEAGSLEEVATDRSASYETVKAEILADVQATLDEAVADGLDEDRAATAIDRITTWLDEGGQLDGLGRRGFAPGMGPGHGHGHGPGWMWNDEETDTDTEES